MTISRKEFIETLKLLTKETMEKKDIPGTAVGIFHQGETETFGCGVTNIEHPQPVSGETLFQIGSITKTFTGTIIMRLVEQGKLDLDTPIRHYLSDFRVADHGVSEQVTTRHLLTHTAGWAGDHFVDTGECVDALYKYMQCMVDLPQISPLGSHFSYNNAGYYLAGHLIEQVGGKTYEELLSETILGPLGMDNAYLYASQVLTHSFAVGHINDDEGPQVARPWGMPRAVGPVGGLVTNAETLLRYARFQIGDGSTDNDKRILSKGSLKSMHEPIVNIRNGESWGLSWEILDIGGTRLIKHGGGTNGQISTLVIAPEHNFAITVLTNADQGTFVTNTVTRQALQLYLGIELPQPEQIETDIDQLSAYTGRYVRPYAEVELGVLGERLIAQVIYNRGFPTEESTPSPPPPPMTLAPCGPDQLIILDGASKNDIVDVVRNEDGSIGWLRFSLRLHAHQVASE